MTPKKTSVDRRGFLQCMAWVGTGAAWTMAGGVLKATPLGHMGRIIGAPAGLHFVQISDSHIGFDKPANPDVTATLREAVARIKASPEPPAFVLHPSEDGRGPPLFGASNVQTLLVFGSVGVSPGAPTYS